MPVHNAHTPPMCHQLISVHFNFNYQMNAALVAASSMVPAYLQGTAGDMTKANFALLQASIPSSSSSSSTAAVAAVAAAAVAAAAVLPAAAKKSRTTTTAAAEQPTGKAEWY